MSWQFNETADLRECLEIFGDCNRSQLNIQEHDDVVRAAKAQELESCLSGLGDCNHFHPNQEKTQGVAQSKLPAIGKGDRHA
jgi:hypothetical protein